MRLRLALFAGLSAATLLLAACHSSEPAPPPADDNAAMAEPEPAPPPPEPVPVPTPQVVEVPKTEAEKPRPAPEVSPDQQVIDDADATGMTARAQRGGDDGGDGQPASVGGTGNDQD